MCRHHALLKSFPLFPRVSMLGVDDANECLGSSFPRNKLRKRRGAIPHSTLKQGLQGDASVFLFLSAQCFDIKFMVLLALAILFAKFIPSTVWILLQGYPATSVQLGRVTGKSVRGPLAAVFLLALGQGAKTMFFRCQHQAGTVGSQLGHS